MSLQSANMNIWIRGAVVVRWGPLWSA